MHSVLVGMDEGMRRLGMFELSYVDNI